MPRGLAIFTVFVTAFIVLMGILGFFAGIATAFGTTEESFFKLGFEIEGALLSILSAIVIAIGVYVSRLAAKLAR